ncbi:MAG: TlpA family protein disulfide reductase [Micrococcales bacterium]
MSLELRLALMAGLVLLAVAAGIWFKMKNGKAKQVTSGEVVDLIKLAAIKDGEPVTKFGQKITFLQFSSEFCSQCATTARTLHDLELHGDGVLHIEVDITNRLDLAKKFSVLQTPTTLVLDARGRITSRIGGAAKAQTLQDEIGIFEI